MNGSTSWFERLKVGLKKTSQQLGEGITALVAKRKLDEETLEELEDLLLATDLGVTCTQKIMQELRKNRFDKEVTDNELKTFLAEAITEILKPYSRPLELKTSEHPHLIIMTGVNGNGKTTTVAKMAHLYSQAGKKVIMAACDTFRAAAGNQLKIWAERVGCKLIEGEQNSDPASVAFKAVQAAQADKNDILFIDTAGRLQNKQNLMEELGKMMRVIHKAGPESPRHILLVLDATTGQNAHSQVELFNQAAPLDGLVITKLDGTAKAGVVVALADRFKLPIVAIGVGEKIDDLRPFSAEEFAKNLVGM